jgi:L-iditol 2-dehydrogenase
MVLDEVELIGDRANPNTAGPTIEMLKNGRIDLSPLMTHRFPLREFATALDIFEARKDGAIKVATKPNGM